LNLLLTGHITPADKQQSDYAYIPFDLPQSARRLRVSYRYSAPISSDEREGGNVIDIGLFDPRGTGFPGGPGFRGWSGSARSEFTITLTKATPGYLPGLLPAGRYHIVLGLYRIWEHGADYEIRVRADPGVAPEPPAFRPPLQHEAPPYSRERPTLWLRGDLQSHTYHSDGKGSPAQLVAKARALGLDFLAITDHNNVSNHPYLAALADENLLLIPGQETTTFYGHMNIWGSGSWCDFRSRSDTEMSTIIQLAHASGGLCSINHPKTDGPPWEYALDLPVDAMEVWQGPWPWRNEESLSLWEGLLNAGRQLTAVGGSDYHCPAGADTNFLRLGQPTTWVKATERSVPAVLDAIRAGRASISAMADGPRLDLKAIAGGVSVGMGEELPLAKGVAAVVEVDIERGAGWTLRLIADGEIAHEVLIKADRAVVRLGARADRYVRAELVGDAPRELLPADIPPDIDLHGWRWALTNPIYVKPVEGDDLDIHHEDTKTQRESDGEGGNAAYDY
jgi:hypothetical protein